MKTLTVTAARRRFGALLNAVQQEPVLVCRRNGDNVVVMSAEQYNRMIGMTSFETELEKLTRRMTGPSKLR
jgi:prevent-host-death family protein